MAIRGVSRVGDLCTGHGGFDPRGADQGSPNVFLNGIPMLRQLDHWPRHTKGKYGHESVTSGGSSTVFCNGRKVARVGDTVDCGSLIAQGSTDVFCG